ELVRFGGAGGDPGRIHRGVEFDAPQPGGLDLVDRGDGLSLARHGLRPLRGQRILAVDDDRDLAVWGEQVAGRAALVDAVRILDRRAGAAVIGHAGGEVLKQVPVVADVLVRIPQAGEQRLAAPVDHGPAGRSLDRARRAHGGDLAVGDQYRPAWEIFAGDRVEHQDIVDEGRRLVGRIEEAVGDILDHRRGRLVLDVLENGPGLLEALGQERDGAGVAEIMVVAVEPDGAGREAEALDEGELDRLRPLR